MRCPEGSCVSGTVGWAGVGQLRQACTLWDVQADKDCFRLLVLGWSVAHVAEGVEPTAFSEGTHGSEECVHVTESNAV